MKIERNKLVFASVLTVIILFLISYVLKLTDKSDETDQLEDVTIPELEDSQKQYDSKLDAINDLKDVRETNAPSIYDEKFLDSLGYYDTDVPDKTKERIVDSIYASGMQYAAKSHVFPDTLTKVTPRERPDLKIVPQEQKVAAKELELAHHLFFAANPAKMNTNSESDTMYAVVAGDQIVKANSRLRMRLTENAVIDGRLIPNNTILFGFISFQPNRALVTIEAINNYPIKLKAYDLEDGSEGIYIENNFRAEATREVYDDVIQDINIPTLPQIGGITKVLRRNNRNVKVTILNNYKLILKAYSPSKI